MPVDELMRPPRPAQSYAEACARFDDLLARDTAEVDPLSRSRLVTPGHRVERVVVYLHGLTNSPQQFTQLSERFISRGYAVLVPRIPYHGYLDRMNTAHSRLRLAQLVDTTAEAVDLAMGLADNVTVTGISLGGVLTIWAAQYRDVAVAAPIAPAIGVPVLPVRATGFVFGAMGRFPNRFVWWDPRHKEQLPGPPYAYPRFSTHALAETQRLGVELMDAAATMPPLAKSVWMISNGADMAVNNGSAALLVSRWRGRGATNVQTYQFPRQLKLFHDLVDPLQPNAQPELVHPILESIIIDGRVPTS
jgi:pimeloyl-ACP methyl ester carboxylesterase